MLYISRVLGVLGVVCAYIAIPVKDYEPVKLIPLTKEHYLPREAEMKKLEETFKEVEEREKKQNARAEHSAALVYLTGKPGRGKTQLALGYAQGFYEKRWFHWYKLSRVFVAYLDASNPSSSYPKLLEALKPGSSKDVQLNIGRMCDIAEEELKKRNSWLLLVDHLHSSNVRFPKPRVKGQDEGRILLITYNHNVIKGLDAAEHILNEMTEEEAVCLLKRVSDYNGKDHEARDLVNFLGRVPLTVTRYKRLCSTLHLYTTIMSNIHMLVSFCIPNT